jgi:hypothetical protein
VVPCLVNRRRRPFPTIPSSQRNPSTPCVSALSSSDRCFSHFDFELSTVNLISVSPFLATLTTSLQLTENTSTLSSAFATLTNLVNHNSFVCHSYKKHRGVGIPSRCHPKSSEGSAFLCPLSPLPRRGYPAKGNLSLASPLILPLVTSHQPPVTNFFRIRTYKKNREGGPTRHGSQLCASALSFLFSSLLDPLVTEHGQPFSGHVPRLTMDLFSARLRVRCASALSFLFSAHGSHLIPSLLHFLTPFPMVDFPFHLDTNGRSTTHITQPSRP